MNQRKRFKQVLLLMLSIIVLLGASIYALDRKQASDRNKTSQDPNLIVTPSMDANEPSNSSSNQDIEEANNTNEDMEDTITPNQDTDDTEDPTKDTEDNKVPVSTNGKEPKETEEKPLPLILAFAGDINFNESSKPIARYDREQKGILGGLSEDLVNEMKAADIMMLNNEFAYSTRGTKIENKSYTFRADPSRVDILHEMGVDIVSLANNHALDYGEEALLDTFTTLDSAKIDYVGAGENLDRAKAPVYYTLKDKTIAYVAASRVIYAMDWYATDTRPGMIGTYDPSLFLETIKEAAANSDYVVAYVHWGVEYNNYPVDYQKTMARQYIDAGADIVVGCHPHVMQGIEIYNGKIIAYSLGNFWFNNATRESALLKVYIDSEDSMKAQLLPVMAKGTYSYILEDKKEVEAYYRFMEEISFEVTFDSDGFMEAK